MSALSVGSLFSGIGLLDFGLTLAGFEHRWFCEKDAFRADLLRRRWPGRYVFADVRAVGALAPAVDVVAGGFPCKGVSGAGRREGFGHPETALWREMLRVVRLLRPRYVLVENVADLLVMHGGECFGEVLGSLAEIGYDAEWDCLPASALGAPHRRNRVFLVATADAGRERRREESGGPSGDEGAATGNAAAEDHEPIRTGAGGLPAAAPTDAGSVAREAAGERLRRPGAGGEPEARREEGPAQSRATGRPNEAPPDADERRLQEFEEGDATGLRPDLESGNDAAGRGVAVEWGEYGAAVERWEVLVGRPAPEPLIRRVDDGRSTRLERSRLSALGDGVLVQAGRLMGERILELHEGRA